MATDASGGAWSVVLLGVPYQQVPEQARARGFFTLGGEERVLYPKSILGISWFPAIFHFPVSRGRSLHTDRFVVDGLHTSRGLQKI